MERRRLKNLREVLKERERLLKLELAVFKDLDETYKYLYSALNLNPKSIGRILTGIGIALILFPEPIVSHFTGSILLGVGLMMDRFRKPYLEDIREEFSRSMKLIKSLREEVSLLKLDDISTYIVKNLS